MLTAVQEKLSATKAHTALCLIGLFTVSWDLVGNVAVGTYNVKLPVLLFASAWVVSWLDSGPVAWVRQAAVARAVMLLAVAYGIAVALAVSVPTAAVQAITVVLGALLPFLAVWRTLRLGDDPAPLLTAFISGAVVAAAFGFYQLAAAYTGLPNPLPYDAFAGGAGRIAAFSYEPAYFAYFLILAVAAWFARESVTGRSHRRWVLGLLVAALVLCNSRAVFLMLPLLAVLLFARRRGVRVPRGLPVTGLLVGYLALIAWVASPGLRTFLAVRVGSISDPNEVTSNAPRLQVYAPTVRLVRDHWLTGVGPGNLLRVGPLYQLPILSWPPPTPNSVVANNIWLQALVDGGAILLAAHVVLVAVVVWRLYRPGGPVAALAAGWLSVVIVGGMLTSWFYDIKLWAVLGLAVGLAAQSITDRAAGASSRSGPASGTTARTGDRSTR